MLLFLTYKLWRIENLISSYNSFKCIQIEKNRLSYTIEHQHRALMIGENVFLGASRAMQASTSLCNRLIDLFSREGNY